MPLIYICFALVAFAILMYVLMDGWDLGVGILFLVAPRDVERDQMMESIVPFWDGNETWLVFGGVTLFATFPAVYAAVLQSMYFPIMIMLFALVFRGVSFEFRARATSSKAPWNWSFGIGSIAAGFAQGVILGRLVEGVQFRLAASGQSLTITLFPLLCGVAMVAGYSLLGAAWLVYKTVGSTQTFGREVSRAAWLFTMASFILVGVWAPISIAEVSGRWFVSPCVFLFGSLGLALAAAFVAFGRSIWRSQSDARLLQLAVAMTLLAFAGVGATIWPYAIPYRVSIIQAAADLSSIKFALVGIVIVLPVVLAYQLFAYRVFSGKVRSGEISYGAPIPKHPDISARRTHEREPALHLS